MKQKYIYKARCIKVVDGDTYDFIIDLGFRMTKEIRVRLARINTPEINSPDPMVRDAGLRAKARAIDLLLLFTESEQWPQVIETFADPAVYNRFTATVTLSDKTDLAETLLKENLGSFVNYGG